MSSNQSKWSRSTRTGVAFSILALGALGAATGCGPNPEAREARADERRSAQIESASAAPIPSAVPSEQPRAVVPPPPPGKDFIDDVRALYRVAACSGDIPVPADLDASVVDAYCSKLTKLLVDYRKRYVGNARPFLTSLQPPGLPTSVVYPFSGGDLVTAITTYPTASDYTTLSLELVGDPRRVHGVKKADLDKSLKRLRIEMGELLDFDDFSRSETLKKTQRGELPHELCFFLVGMAIQEMEPVSAKFFRIEDDGTLHYFTEEEITASEANLAANRKGTWTAPDFSETFANVELGFRHVGDPNAPVIYQRHIAVNLDNDHLGNNVLTYLDKRGKVSAMVKAASYLLWLDGFSNIRKYLTDHAVFIISDSTGIPPAIAKQEGFVQETYGYYAGSLLPTDNAMNKTFDDLWKNQPHRKLPTRFGYKDRAGKDHLMVTKKADLPAAPAAAPATTPATAPSATPAPAPKP